MAVYLPVVVLPLSSSLVLRDDPLDEDEVSRRRKAAPSCSSSGNVVTTGSLPSFVQVS